MATPNRFALRDAGDVTFYDLTSGKAIVTLESVKEANMEFSGETTYARGGYGNPKLVGFSSNREGTFSLTEALFDKNAIAMLTGNELTEGTKTIKFNEKKEVISNKVTLSKTPVGAIDSVYELLPDGTNGQEYTLGDPTTNDDEYSITDKEITFSTSVSNGKNIRVYYNVDTPTDAKNMRVSSDAFGGTFRVVADVIVKDSENGQLFAAQVEIPRGKFEDNFSFSLSVDGDPATLDMPIEMLKDPLTNNLWEMTIYDEDAIV